MKRLVRAAIVIALGGVSATSVADDGNFFVNADAGQANYRVDSLRRVDSSLYDPGYLSSNDKKDAAGALRFGYRWHSVVDYGVEAGYADLGQAQTKSFLPSDIKSRGWLLGGNLKYNINDAWYISARGGWFRSRIESKGTTAASPPCLPGMYCPDDMGFARYRNSSSDTGEYLGAGVGYNFSPHFSLGLSYDNYHAHANGSANGDGVNVALYSVSAEYRF